MERHERIVESDPLAGFTVTPPAAETKDIAVPAETKDVKKPAERKAVKPQ
jgi:hypothetical protein